MTTFVVDDGRPIGLSPVSVEALTAMALDQRAHRATPIGLIHPACRLRLLGLGLIETDRGDTIVRLTDAGLDVVDQLDGRAP